MRSGPFPPGEISRGRGGTGRGSSRGTPRGAEARRLCCFSDRAAAAATTKIVVVTAAGIGAALGEQQRGRRPLTPLWRGRAERSSCATVSGAGRGGAGSVRLPAPLQSGSRPVGTRLSLPRPPGLGVGTARCGAGEGSPGLWTPRFLFWGASFLGTVLPGPSAPDGAPGPRSKRRGAPSSISCLLHGGLRRRTSEEAREHGLLIP